MATNNSQLVRELNDLVHIQNDRIAGYENAIKHLQEKNIDLLELFNRMIDTSMEQRSQLSAEIGAQGGRADEGTTVSGKIFRAWMDINAAITNATNAGRRSILENCRHGEQAAQKAYAKVLDSNIPMSMDLRHMLLMQQKELKLELNEIYALEEIAESKN